VNIGALCSRSTQSQAHYLLAKALDLAGNRDEARIEAARAVELDSSQPEFKALQSNSTKNDS